MLKALGRIIALILSLTFYSLRTVLDITALGITSTHLGVRLSYQSIPPYKRLYFYVLSTTTDTPQCKQYALENLHIAGRNPPLAS